MLFEDRISIPETVDITPEDLKAAFLLEKPLPSISNYTSFALTGELSFVLEDIRFLVEKIVKNKISDEDIISYWKFEIDEAINANILQITVEPQEEYLPQLRGSASDFWYAFDAIVDYAYGGIDWSLESLEKEILPFIDEAIAFRNIPIEKREYSENEKSAFIFDMDRQEILEEASDTVVALFKKFTEELCEKNDPAALRAKAYGCYGGNKVFECDWEASADCLLKLAEIDEDPAIHNSLGYIYYYGRCTDGQPDYERAFQEFSIGAAGGVIESRYKLADMYGKGLGTKKNSLVAENIITELYNESLSDLINGYHECKFADIALRMGGLQENSFVEETHDLLAAYYYYLQAREAIKLRKEANFYGDNVVEKNIENAIARVEEKLGNTIRNSKTISFDDLWFVLRQNLVVGRRLKIKVRALKNGKYSLTIKPLKRYEDEDVKLLLTLPDIGYCGFLDHIIVKYAPLYSEDVLENNSEYVFDSYYYPFLFDYGKPQISFEGEFKISVKR